MVAGVRHMGCTSQRRGSVRFGGCVTLWIVTPGADGDSALSAVEHAPNDPSPEHVQVHTLGGRHADWLSVDCGDDAVGGRGDGPGGRAGSPTRATGLLHRRWVGV